MPFTCPVTPHKMYFTIKNIKNPPTNAMATGKPSSAISVNISAIKLFIAQYVRILYNISS